MRFLIATILLAFFPASSDAFFGCLAERIRENARNRMIVDMLGQRIYFIQPQPQQPPPIVNIIPQIIGNLPVQPSFPIQPPANGFPGQLPIPIPQPPTQSVRYQWQPALIFQSDAYGRVTPVYRYIPVLR